MVKYAYHNHAILRDHMQEEMCAECPTADSDAKIGSQGRQVREGRQQVEGMMKSGRIGIGGIFTEVTSTVSVYLIEIGDRCCR